MSDVSAAPSGRLRPSIYRAETSGTRAALRYARNVWDAIDRHMPEAGAMAAWLSENGGLFGLSDDIPDANRLGKKYVGLDETDWNRVDAALRAAEAGLTGAADGAAERWIAATADVLGLDPLEARILDLVLHYGLDKRVDELAATMLRCRDAFGDCRELKRVAAMLLDAPPVEVARRLTTDAKLLASGLLTLDHRNRLSVLERLQSLVSRDIPPAADLYDQLLGSTQAAPLSWESFAHLGREAEVAAAVLRAALAGHESGVNILLYGPPGTGKTSFAATLAARTGARLRPVAEADDDGGEPSRSERLAGLRLAQRLATPGDTLLLFDEAEDLFARPSREDDEPVTSSRVFIHRLIERTNLPVIWTANDIGVLGPAVLRRMTMCLELRIPGIATRTALWRRLGEAHGVALGQADAARLARLVPAAPAVAATALRATRLAGGDAETARLVVEGVARAVGGGGLPAPEPEPDKAFDPELVNADCDLAALLEDLLRPDAPRAVSFLLSGPPGAGKSAWVRHLAGRMGLPVLQKRASDLLDAFVGGTEQNIAAAFAEARDTNAFLVFDEADSLLLERVDASRTWEVTQVNEMLTWMESHALPFACTTNLPGRLDRASLRRFLVKLRFDWLTPAQARLAFRRLFGLMPPDELDALRTLTPADFALVRRRAAVRGGATDPATLLRLLAAECEGRIGGRVPLGFEVAARRR